MLEAHLIYVADASEFGTSAFATLISYCLLPPFFAFSYKSPIILEAGKREATSISTRIFNSAPLTSWEGFFASPTNGEGKANNLQNKKGGISFFNVSDISQLDEQITCS